MMHLYDGECRFCRVPLQLEIDDEYMSLRGGVFGDIPTIIKLAACNRCGDYEAMKRRICDKMAKAARALGLELYASRGQSDLARNARENMKLIWDRWCDHVAGHHLVETVRDSSFVADLAEKPDNWMRVMTMYERLIVMEKSRPV